MKILTFSADYSHATRPIHGNFVETRLRYLLANGQVESRVVAPVPWFPSRNSRFGEYVVHASARREEQRHGIRVLHPRIPVLPKIAMTRESYGTGVATDWFPNGVASAYFSPAAVPYDANTIRSQLTLYRRIVRGNACTAAARDDKQGQS